MAATPSPSVAVRRREKDKKRRKEGGGGLSVRGSEGVSEREKSGKEGDVDDVFIYIYFFFI